MLQILQGMDYFLNLQLIKKYLKIIFSFSEYSQMIAPGSPREFLRIVRSQSGRKDSNLRPSAPKALDSSSAALGFQAIAKFLLDSA